MEIDEIWGLITEFWEELPWAELSPVIIAAALVIAGIAVFRRIFRKPEFDSADPLQRQARKREGVVRDSSSERRLEFSYRSMPIVFSLKSEQTTLLVDIGAFANVLLSIDREIKTDSPEFKRFVTENIKFDDELMVKTNAPDFAKKFLTRDVQQLLLEFKRGNESFNLSVADAFLNLCVNTRLEKEIEIDRIVTLALLLCDRLKFAQKSFSA